MQKLRDLQGQLAAADERAAGADSHAAGLAAQLAAAQEKLAAAEAEAEARAAEAARLSEAVQAQGEQVAQLQSKVEVEEQGRLAASSQVDVSCARPWAGGGLRLDA